jgi:gas vesicle protein GvpG
MLTEFIGWVLRTVTTAAEAEMNDDAALREQLLEAAMRHETGEISDEEFAALEADLLKRINEIRERRGESGPLVAGAQPIDMSGDAQVHVEASVTGDFHERTDAPHTTVIERTPDHEERVSILDLKPGQAEGTPVPGLPLSAPPRRIARVRARRKARKDRISRP